MMAGGKKKPPLMNIPSSIKMVDLAAKHGFTPKSDSEKRTVRERLKLEVSNSLNVPAPNSGSDLKHDTEVDDSWASLPVFDEPIVFQRAYVSLTGSAVAALFLSYAIYTTEHLPKDAEGWFRKTGDEWKAETGLTRFEQQTARRILRELDVLIERRAGLPAELWFKIRIDRILELLPGVQTHPAG